MNNGKLGIAIIGLGGAVGTTMVAGIELLKKGLVDKTGLPLAESCNKDLVSYENITFAGWDLFGENLAKAAEGHEVLTHKQFVAVAEDLHKIKPWPAIGNRNFLENIEGENKFDETVSHREIIGKVRENLREFKAQCDSVVVINLASTEKIADENNGIFSLPEAFESALDSNSQDISPAMLYAYATIAEQIPYGNFTPSLAADIPALVELAEKMKVPIAGKDGKTGQTMIKSVLAPAFKTRALKVDGWYSTNILGNRDGLALSNAESLASKVKTKSSLLDDILGYKVEDHIVDIRYYRPRGDNKEAWDNIDLRGFLGQTMQIKVNFLCKDSILAAPLAIEIARCLDLAQKRNESGVIEELSIFFKMPMRRTKSSKAENALHKQEEILLNWLKN
jgi:myo-inositol-1-phosphate synthase